MNFSEQIRVKKSFTKTAAIAIMTYVEIKEDSLFSHR